MFTEMQEAAMHVRGVLASGDPKATQRDYTAATKASMGQGVHEIVKNVCRLYDDIYLNPIPELYNKIIDEVEEIEADEVAKKDYEAAESNVIAGLLNSNYLKSLENISTTLLLIETELRKDCPDAELLTTYAAVIDCMKLDRNV